MLRSLIIALSLALALASVAAAQDAKTSAPSPTQQYQRLLEESEEGASPRELSAEFFELAERFPQDPVAVDALVWVVTKLRNRPEATRALEMLAKDQLHSEKLAAACARVARTPSPAAETLLRAALEKSPHAEVRAQACWHLADVLEQQAIVVEQLAQQPDLADRLRQYYGAAYGDHLASLDRPTLDGKREEVYRRMLESFAEEPAPPEGTMGEFAEKALFRIRHLSIGRVAPEIEGEDIFGERFKLSDYRGKVVVLSFWGHW
jgi:hypothetical protein